MGQPGAKKKAGQRYGCGKLRPTVPAEDSEKVTVLMQPHREGDRNQMRESPLGRFILKAIRHDDRLGRTYYDAALSYSKLVAQWRRAWGADVYVSPPDSMSSGTGEGPSSALMEAWRAQVKAIRGRILREAGPAVLLWTDILIIDELEAPTADPPQVLNGLWIIATELGKLDGRLNKMA